MKFPETNIDERLYESQLSELINDTDCVIFLDTNILSFLYKINKSARGEFYNWIKLISSQNRLFVPKWVAHEYSKRVINNADTDYLGEVKQLSDISQKLSSNLKYISMFIDSSIVQGTSYSTPNEYVTELQTTNKILKRLATVLKTTNTIKTLREEIKEYFEDRILDSDIYSIVSDIENRAANRYRHNLPPGFRDENKEKNPCGDLIIWEEILHYCSHNNKQKAILLTRDKKRDFVYCVDVADHHCKLTDVRLVDEFCLHTNSDQFYIIDIEKLITIFSQCKPEDFVALAQAIQIENVKKEDKVSKSQANENIDSDKITEQNLENEPTEEIVADHKEEIAANPQTEDNQAISLSFSELAICDERFNYTDDSPIVETINKLRSYNWGTQNNILTRIPSVINELDLTQQQSVDALFVFGRNLYQAACGNAFSIIYYIQNLESNLNQYTPLVANSIVAGCLFEIFFNPQGDIRNIYKSRFGNLILRLPREKYAQAFKYVENKLSTYTNDYIIYTEYNQPLISIIVTYNTRESDSPFLDSMYNFIENVEIEGRNVEITPALNNFFPQTIDLSNLADYIATIYCLTNSRLTLSYCPALENENHYKFAVEGTLSSKIKKGSE